MERKLNFVLSCLFILNILPFTLHAQSSDQWWTSGSYSDTIKSIHFHSTGSYSFSNKTGMMSSTSHSGKIANVARKGVVTNYAEYGIDKFKLDLDSYLFQYKFATSSSYFTDFIDVDLNRRFFTQFGFIWERDDMLLLKNRYTFYVGLGLNGQVSKKLYLKSLVAFGRINQDYTVPVDKIDVIKRPNSAFYTIHKCNYLIRKGILLKGQLYYFDVLSESDRYRFGVDLTLQVALTKQINLMTGYNYKYDSELNGFGVVPDMSAQYAGIEVNF